MSPSPRLRLVGVIVACTAVLLWWLLRDDRPKGDARTGAAAQSDDNGESSSGGRSWFGFHSSSSAQPAERTFSLEGKVVYLDGRPAEGATVRILSRPSAGRVSMAPDRQAVSDAEGGFSFDHQLGGEYVLQAQKDDSVSPSVRARLTADTKPVTLMLVAGASLTITVVSSADSRPIPNAIVRVQLSNDQVMQGDAFVERRTNDAGQARFFGLDPVGNHAVWAEADGYAGKQINVMPRDNAGTTWNERIVLAAGTSVSGRVVDARGNGVPGALVGWCNTVETLDESAFRVFMPFSDYGRMSEKTTDADGHYRLSVPTNTGGCVVAEKPGLRVGIKCNVPVKLGQETRDVDVVLLDGVIVKGRVVEPGGRPAVNAEVLATTPDTIHQPSMHKAYRYKVRTDGDGRFVMKGLPAIPMALAATSDSASSPLFEFDARKPPGEIVLTLEYDGTIDGTVVESDGKPVPYAAVNYWIEPDFPALEAANHGKPPTVIKQYALPTNNEATVADADGHFHAGGLAPGKYAVRAMRPTAMAVPPAYGGATQYQVSTGANIKLTMPAIGAIRGRVRDLDDNPVHTFRVSLLVGGPGNNAPDYLFPVAHPFISADGSFVYDGVPANHYIVRIEGEDFVAKRVPIDVKSDVADLGTVSVQRGLPARPGLVVDADRDPIPRATITIAMPDVGGTLQLWSESDGTFRVPPVPQGTTMRLRADWAGGGASQWTTMSPDDNNVTLVVETKGNSSVRGVLVDGGDLQGRIVVLSMPGDRPPGTGETSVRGTAQTQSGGVFTFEQVPPGSYVLWAPLGKEFARLATPVEVVEGRDTNVVFDVTNSPRVAR